MTSPADAAALSARVPSDALPGRSDARMNMLRGNCRMCAPISSSWIGAGEALDDDLAGWGIRSLVTADFGHPGYRFMAALCGKAPNCYTRAMSEPAVVMPAGVIDRLRAAASKL